MAMMALEVFPSCPSRFDPICLRGLPYTCGPQPWSHPILTLRRTKATELNRRRSTEHQRPLPHRRVRHLLSKKSREVTWIPTHTILYLILWYEVRCVAF